MSDNTIKKIIAQACTHAIANINPPGAYPLDETVIEEAAQQIREYILDVIGEDEPYKQDVIGLPSGINEIPAGARNQLRAEQRKKLG